MQIFNIFAEHLTSFGTQVPKICLVARVRMVTKKSFAHHPTDLLTPAD